MGSFAQDDCAEPLSLRYHFFSMVHQGQQPAVNIPDKVLSLLAFPNLKPGEEASQFAVGEAVWLRSEPLAPSNRLGHLTEDLLIIPSEPSERISLWRWPAEPLEKGPGIFCWMALGGEDIRGLIIRKVQSQIPVKVRKDLSDDLLERPGLAGCPGFPLLHDPLS